jgi:hypothetical protein
MDPIRRDILTTGAVAAVTAAAPQVFAQQPDPGGAFRFYEKGDVCIRYQDVGSGFPLLVIPGGGLNSRISNWWKADIPERSLPASRIARSGACMSCRHGTGPIFGSDRINGEPPDTGPQRISMIRRSSGRRVRNRPVPHAIEWDDQAGAERRPRRSYN